MTSSAMKARPQNNPDDLTGKRFGKLVCVDVVESTRGSRRISWNCRCDCGSVTIAQAMSLKNGDKKSCGCLRASRKVHTEDLIGERFGKLTVIGVHEELRAKSLKVRCDCGTVTKRNLIELERVLIPSCGCVHSGVGGRKTGPKAKDLTGQVFNRLTVMSFSHKNADYNSFWNCKCSCGTEKIVSRQLLANGQAQSCGCLGDEVRARNSNALSKEHCCTRCKRVKPASQFGRYPASQGRKAYCLECEHES